MEIKTNIELLNEISVKLGGKSDASVLVEGLNNIANALGDTDPDQMVTVPQALQTLLAYIEGGGGDAFHPLFKLNLTVNQDMYVFDEGVVWVSLEGNIYTINSGIMTQLTQDNGTLVEANTPVSIVEAMTATRELDEELTIVHPFAFVLNDWPEPVSATATNLVNCTYDDNNWRIIITDPTKDASADFNVTFG